MVSWRLGKSIGAVRCGALLPVAQKFVGRFILSGEAFFQVVFGRQADGTASVRFPGSAILSLRDVNCAWAASCDFALALLFTVSEALKWP